MRLKAILLVPFLGLGGWFGEAAHAQTEINVSSASELTSALSQAFANSEANSSALTTITLTGNISATSQMIVNANVQIVGGGFTIDMNNADRAFFIAGGNVTISNLTIQNGNATGGSGGLGGGGGAGLGGAVFVGSGVYYGGVDPTTGTASVAAQGISAPNVTLSSVSFLNNQAVGGSVGYAVGAQFGSGGGAMGGNASTGGGNSGGGGGGGFGNTASGAGGTGNNGAAGAFINVSAVNGTDLSAGAGGSGGSGSGGLGGANGGGGGGGAGADNSFPGTGGGGGVAGGRGYFDNSTFPNNGGNGGFGGGGGSNDGQNGSGGNGGFGGGGGASVAGNGGSGGFGGGGGAYSTGSAAAGAGGFGAAGATSSGGTGNASAGGGGFGGGGALFVMAGATVTVQNGNFSSNAVAAGSGGNGNAGSAYGADLFLGANTTFNVSSSLSVNSLGGAGNLSDPNVASHASDANAQGGLVKTGPGALTLTGVSYYSGPTVVNTGALGLGAGAKEQGTSLVTVGQNPGDSATLTLGSSSNLTLGGFSGLSGTDQPVMIAQSTGSTGAVVIGGGAGSSGADIGARVFTGGSGSASLVFTQQYAAGSASDTAYPFFTTITGSLSVVQSGNGTTQLQPLYGANTFTGGVVVNQGALQLASTGALPGGNDVALNGGALQTAVPVSLTLGALTLSAPSRIDFLGTSSEFTFDSLTIGGSLAIWNYSAADTLAIASGTATGSLSQISFYSDAGATFLGTGQFVGNTIVPVPEPGTTALLFVALPLAVCLWRRRRRTARCEAA